MLHKLLTLVGLGVPRATGLPTVIYAASTAGNWEESWVARVEGIDEVLRCTGNGGDVENIGYKILVVSDAGKKSGIKLFAEHIPGYERVRHGILLRFQAAEKNFMLSDANEHGHASEGGGGVYCKSGVKWNKDGVMIGGKAVNQGGTNSVEWENNLSTIEGQIKREKGTDCKKYLMKVVCNLKWADEKGGKIYSTSKPGQEGSQITISGSLPTLVYRPF